MSCDRVMGAVLKCDKRQTSSNRHARKWQTTSLSKLSLSREISSRSGPLSPPRGATWPSGEWGYSTRRHMLEPVRSEAGLLDKALCLPTFSSPPVT